MDFSYLSLLLLWESRVPHNLFGSLWSMLFYLGFWFGVSWSFGHGASGICVLRPLSPNGAAFIFVSFLYFWERVDSWSAEGMTGGGYIMAIPELVAYLYQLEIFLCGAVLTTACTGLGLGLGRGIALVKQAKQMAMLFFLGCPVGWQLGTLDSLASSWIELGINRDSYFGTSFWTRESTSWSTASYRSVPGPPQPTRAR
ncbi:hypothetical protein B0T25DRAFT_539463 [Lasiosphaeria hispida]|uniref:Uncharacterized protein n=1 Tax=Lasiosphaeria hispida TaxID=260671 RepID=A0AAJ0MG87_9PEZI|nr:hypothetical protein B0T25DRAFT_539463 [Lasiosphaeria hispida]